MTPNPPNPNSAFSLVEMLIAAVIGAAVITGAVMGFGVISGLSLNRGTTNVELPSGVMANWYGTNVSYVTLGNNPNYFQAAQARRMKDRLMTDVLASSAVFCLGRNVVTTPAERVLTWPLVSDTDFRQYATPSTFRNFLVGANSDMADIFPASQDGPLLNKTNATIFLVGTLSSILQRPNTLTILAIYEMDFVPTVKPAGGTVASVRRYSGTNTAVPTDYYHVYYPEESNGSNGFRPLAAFFGRKAADPGGTDPFHVAINQPFTFVWWPDPLVSTLEGNAIPSFTSSSARGNYSNMAERTSLFFVLPAFPSL